MTLAEMIDDLKYAPTYVLIADALEAKDWDTMAKLIAELPEPQCKRFIAALRKSNREIENRFKKPDPPANT